MNLTSLQQVLQIISSIISILGFPIGLYLFYAAKRKEQLDREYGTYNSLDEKYIEYLKLCLQNPELDIFDIPLNPDREVTLDQVRKEEIFFSILVSILERAYLMYKDQSNETKKVQFSGWEYYMHSWSSRANFQRAWKKVGFDSRTYDEGFYKYMNSLIDANLASTSEVKSPSSS